MIKKKPCRLSDRALQKIQSLSFSHIITITQDHDQGIDHTWNEE
jgi:hypothetical protein